MKTPQLFTFVRYPHQNFFWKMVTSPEQIEDTSAAEEVMQRLNGLNDKGIEDFNKVNDHFGGNDEETDLSYEQLRSGIDAFNQMFVMRGLLDGSVPTMSETYKKKLADGPLLINAKGGCHTCPEGQEFAETVEAYDFPEDVELDD